MTTEWELGRTETQTDPSPDTDLVILIPPTAGEAPTLRDVDSFRKDMLGDISDDVVEVNSVDHETTFTYPWNSTRTAQGRNAQEFHIFAQIIFGAAVVAGDVLIADIEWGVVPSSITDLEFRVQDSADNNLDDQATEIHGGRRQRYVVPITTSAPSSSVGIRGFYNSGDNNQHMLSWTVHSLVVMRQATDGAVTAVTAADDYLAPRIGGSTAGVAITPGIVAKALHPPFPAETDLATSAPGTITTQVATGVDFEQAISVNDRILVDIEVRSIDADLTNLTLVLNDLGNSQDATNQVAVPRSGRNWLVLNARMAGTTTSTYRLNLLVDSADADAHAADIVIHAVGLLTGSGADVTDVIQIADGWLRRNVVVEWAPSLHLVTGQVVREGSDLFVVLTTHVASSTEPGQDPMNYQVLNIYRGQWARGNNYYVGQIVTWTGLHICRVDVLNSQTGPDGDGEHWDTLGVFKGAWTDGWFEPFDGIESNGNVYLCRARRRNTGLRPEDDSDGWWRLDGMSTTDIQAVIGTLQAWTIDSNTVRIGLRRGSGDTADDYTTVDLPGAGTSVDGDGVRTGYGGTINAAQALKLYGIEEGAQRNATLDWWTGSWAYDSDYAVGQVVGYDGSIYMCISAHSAVGTTGSAPDASTNWEVIFALDFELTSQGQLRARIDHGQLGSGQQSGWRDVPGIMIYRGEWSNTVTYLEGHVVKRLGWLWYCQATNINSTPSEGTNWTRMAPHVRASVAVRTMIWWGDWVNNLLYYEGAVVKRNSHVYIATNDIPAGNAPGGTTVQSGWWTEII